MRSAALPEFVRGVGACSCDGRLVDPWAVGSPTGRPWVVGTAHRIAAMRSEATSTAGKFRHADASEGTVRFASDDGNGLPCRPEMDHGPGGIRRYVVCDIGCGGISRAKERREVPRPVCRCVLGHVALRATG